MCQIDDDPEIHWFKTCSKQSSERDPVNQHDPFIQPKRGPKTMNELEQAVKDKTRIPVKVAEKHNDVRVTIGSMSRTSSDAFIVDVHAAWMMYTTNVPKNYDIGIIITKDIMKPELPQYPNSYVRPICLPTA